MKPKVSIIVLNMNGLNFLETCIPSVKNQTYENIEIIVTDNNSTDGSKEYLRKAHTDVKIIENEDNYGYCKANNIGANAAKGEFILFLNNDTEMFPDMIEKLVNCYKSKSIINPSQILSSNKGNDETGAAITGMDIFGYPYVTKERKKTKPFYVDGAGIFIKKKDFMEIGMFDEALFIFQEDIDLSWRAQIMGYKIKPCCEAKFYHYSGGLVVGGMRTNEEHKYETSYFRRYLNEKNVIRNLIKNYSFPFLVVLIPILFLIHVVEIIALLLMLEFKAAACYFKAYWWNVRNFRETIKYRREFQKKRMVSDSTLIKRMHLSYSKLNSIRMVGIPKFK